MIIIGVVVMEAEFVVDVAVILVGTVEVVMMVVVVALVW